MVRAVGGGGGKSGRDDDSAADGFARGDKVEARYGGKSKWYKGKIARVNANGTFDVTYDDGDSERGIRASMIRAVGGASRSRSPRRAADSGDEASELQRGDKCEARYGGKSKWYVG